ncbi:MAG: hypothetical protein AAF630_05810 [Cyanobacteria bacterium P01_C01_bin.38]
MFNHAALGFLTIGFTALFSNQVTLAQSVNVYFSGTVEPHASFSSYTPGKIESSFSGKAGKSTNGFTNITPAKINVQTSNPTTISVSSVESSSTNTVDKLHTATLRTDSGQVTGKNITLPAGNNTVEVDMSLKQNQRFAPGTYTYDVTLTMVSP